MSMAITAHGGASAIQASRPVARPETTPSGGIQAPEPQHARLVGADRVSISSEGRARANAYQALKTTSRILKNDEVVLGNGLDVLA